jgi:hypothetical protein
MSKKCRYGLILSKKAQQLHHALQKPSVFGNGSDEEEVKKPPKCYFCIVGHRTF